MPLLPGVALNRVNRRVEKSHIQPNIWKTTHVQRFRYTICNLQRPALWMTVHHTHLGASSRTRGVGEGGQGGARSKFGVQEPVSMQNPSPAPWGQGWEQLLRPLGCRLGLLRGWSMRSQAGKGVRAVRCC